MLYPSAPVNESATVDAWASPAPIANAGFGPAVDSTNSPAPCPIINAVVPSGDFVPCVSFALIKSAIPSKNALAGLTKSTDVGSPLACCPCVTQTYGSSSRFPVCPLITITHSFRYLRFELCYPPLNCCKCFLSSIFCVSYA